MSPGFANHFLHGSNGVESVTTLCLTSLLCRLLVWALYTSQLCMTSGLTRLASRSDSVVFPHCAQELPITGRWNFIGFWIWNFLQRLIDLNTVPRDSVMKGLGGGGSPEEVSHWGWALRSDILALLPVYFSLPDYRCNRTSKLTLAPAC